MNQPAPVSSVPEADQDDSRKPQQFHTRLYCRITPKYRRRQGRLDQELGKSQPLLREFVDPRRGSAAQLAAAIRTQVAITTLSARMNTTLGFFSDAMGEVSCAGSAGLSTSGTCGRLSCACAYPTTMARASAPRRHARFQSRMFMVSSSVTRKLDLEGEEQWSQRSLVRRGLRS
jgi:hypothetical protein